MRSPGFRSIARLFSLVAIAAASACGGPDAPPIMPNALVGTYTVNVEANGKTDETTMTVVRGSDEQVVLTFTAGFSPIRSSVMGSTELKIPRQTIDLDYPTGAGEALVAGTGTIGADGIVALTFDVTTVGFTYQTDGGTTDQVQFTITGTRLPQ